VQRSEAWTTWCQVREEFGTDEQAESLMRLDERRDRIFNEMMATPLVTLDDAAVLGWAARLCALSEYWSNRRKTLIGNRSWFAA
jgi:hypothetical protein